MKQTVRWFAATLVAVTLLHAETGYKLSGRYPIDGTEGWDYVTLDGAARRLYVSHGTQVEVLNADSGAKVGVVADTPGVHGVAIATGTDRGFTSNGRENKVSIFNTKTLKLIEKIDVGMGPDGIYFDPASKRVFTNNHGSHNISAIDAASGKVVGTVDVKGDGEQAVIGKDGLVYVNLEDTAEVVAFDPKSLQVKKRWPIGVAKTPTGLAYDAKTNHLFIATRDEPKMIVMDASSGKTIASFPIGAGADFAAFDADSRLIFISCGTAGVLNVFHETSAGTYEDAGAVHTQISAKTLAFDAKTKKLFLPAAEYLESPNTDKSQRPTRTVKPGSFGVLVVSK